MAIVLQGTPSVYEADPGTAAIIPFPAGITAGELLLATITVSLATAGTTAPSGWTLVMAQNGPTTTPSTSVFYKIATGAESGSETFAVASSNKLTGVMSRWSGVDSTTPMDATAVGANVGTSNSFTMPSITTATAGAMLVHVLSLNASAAGNEVNTLAGTTKFSDSTGIGRRQTAFYEERATAGATGTRGWTKSGATTVQWSGVTVALRPGASGPAVPALVRAVGGIPTTTSMTVKVGTTNATSVRIKAGTNSALTTGVVWGGAVTPDGNGNSQLTVTGLTPNTAYFYRIAMTDSGAVESLDTWTDVGQFKTDLDGVLAFSFAFGSCTNSTDSASMAAIAVKKPDLFFHLGDEYYADASGTTVANFRTKMGDKLTATNHKAVYRTSGSAWLPSDHDAMNNNGNYAADPTAWTNWNQVFREMKPDTGLPGSMGVYRTFKRGRVRFIAIDRRSFATAAGATDNSSKTCLGTTQKQWFKDQITAATEPVIVVLNSDPWIITTDAGDDGWGGYITERDELAAYISASGKNVAFLAGDMHALAAEDGSSSPGGVPVFQAAPFYQNASIKGGPYDVGPYPASGTAVVQQYGWMDVTDSGSSISLIFKGFSSDNTQRVTLTKTYAATVAYTGTLALSAAGSLAPVSAGLTVKALKWSEAKRLTTIGQGAARVLSIGDSTTLGYGTGGVTESYPYGLRDLFGAIAETGMVIPSNTAAVVDSRWGVGTGAAGDWLISGSFGWGNRSSYRASTATTNDLVFTPGYTFDTVDFYYITSTTNATAPVHVGGALVGSLVSGGKAAGWEKATISVPAGSTSVTLKPPGGNFWINGIHARTAGRSAINFSNAGASGSATTNWISGSYDSRKGIAAFAPDLTIISLGINDSTAAVTAATYKTNLQALILEAQITGDVIVWTNPPSVDLSGRLALQQQYRTAVYELAGTMGFSVVDIFSRWGTHEAADAAGWMSDTVHPSASGYDVIAAAVHDTVNAATVFASTVNLSAAGTQTRPTAVPKPAAALALTGAGTQTRAPGAGTAAGTLQNLYLGTPQVGGSDETSSVNLGTEFYVTAPGWVTQVRFLQPIAPFYTATSKVATIWSTTDGITGTMVAGPFTIPAGAPGTWNTYDLPTPLALTANTRYRAVVRFPDGKYPATLNYFNTGDNANTTTRGILVIPNAFDALNDEQGTFKYSASDAFTDGTYQSSAYYTDVTVSDTDPSTTGAGLTLSGNLALGAAGTLSQSAVAAVSGSRALSAAGTLSLSGTATQYATGSLALSATGTQTRAALPSWAQTLAPTANGALAFTGPSPRLVAARALTGNGELSFLGGAMTQSGACALTGAGALTYARGAMGAAASRALTASGTIALAGGKNVGDSLALSAAGTQTRSALAGFARALALSGAGTLSLSTTSEFAGTVALSAAGTMGLARGGMSGGSVLDRTVTGTLTRVVAALHAAQTENLSAAGTLARSSAAATMTSTCQLGAATSLILTSENSFSGLLTLTATGTLSGAGTPGPKFNQTPAAVGVLALDATYMVQTDAVGLTGSGTLTAESSAMGGKGTVARTATGSLTLTAGTPRPAATLARTAAGTLTGQATLTTQSATLARSIIGALFLSASGNGMGSIPFGASGTLNTAANDPGLKQTLSRTATGLLSAFISGQSVAQTLGTSASGSLTAVGTVLGTCQLGASGTLTGTGKPGNAGALALTGSGELSEVGGVNSDLVLYATGSLVLTAGDMSQAGATALTASGALTLSALLAPAALLELSADGNLGVDPGTAGTSAMLARTASGGLAQLTDTMSVIRVLSLLAEGEIAFRFLPQNAVGVLLLSASCQLDLDWIPGRARTRIMPPKYHALIKARRSLNQ